MLTSAEEGEVAEHALRVASVGDTNVGLFLLGGAIWFALCFAAGIRMVHFQTVYLRLYGQIEQPNFPVTPEELTGRLGLPPSLIWRLWRLVWERQSNPTLEAARRRGVRWYWITAAVVMLGGAIPLAVLMVGN